MATMQKDLAEKLEKANQRNNDRGLKRIVGLIDSFIDGGAVEPMNAQWVLGEIAKLEHADNDNGSTLHPLTAFHFSTGKNDHYTLQSGWIQTLCLRHMGLIDDSGLQIMTSAAVTATKKSDVKAAQDQAYGKEIQSIDNIHFYLQGSSVDTCAVTLTSVRTLVVNALRKMGRLGAEIIAKDDDFLEGKNLENYRLKALEAAAWDRLKALLESVAASDRPFIQRGQTTRKVTAHTLFDALVRARDTGQEDDGD